MPCSRRSRCSLPSVAPGRGAACSSVMLADSLGVNRYLTVPHAHSMIPHRWYYNVPNHKDVIFLPSSRRSIPMTELVVRRLLIDLETPFDRHWCGGDAFRTAFFNALSMSFPVGEQFFIDAVKGGHKAMPPEQHAQFAGADPRHPLAVTAANEHFTALLAEWLLAHPETLAGAEPRLATMWQWHCAEEAEHKNTAFDIYQALGGNHEWRITWFRRITLVFLGDALRQTVLNLRRDGTLWKWTTWASAARTLFGKGGLVRETWRQWREYLRRDFHPSQHGTDLSQQWLTQHSDAYVPVGAR